MILKTSQEISELLNHTDNLYLAGAGEYGTMIGEYLAFHAINWKGYVDKSTHIRSVSIPVFSYEEVDKKGVFLITSIQYASDIRRELIQSGVSDRAIYVPETRRLIYELYGDANLLMKKLLDGSYRESTFGDADPDKQYMVMERSMIYEGIFSNVRRFLMGIDYADRMGYVPVVDQLYYPAFEYQNYETVGIDNPWLYFYEQPGYVDLGYVKANCRNVRFYNMDDSVNVEYLSEAVRISRNGIWRVDRWHELINKYIRLNADIKEEIEDEYRKLFPSGKKVLGVKVREGFAVNIAKRNNHGSLPLQPEVQEVIRDVKEYKEKWDTPFIYLMCETKDTEKLFRKEFGEYLLLTDRYRPLVDEFPSTKELMWNLLHNPDQDNVALARKYLVETYLLSKCDALIGSDNGATQIAIMIKGGYDHMLVYQKGYSDSYSV